MMFMKNRFACWCTLAFAILLLFICVPILGQTYSLYTGESQTFSINFPSGAIDRHCSWSVGSHLAIDDAKSTSPTITVFGYFDGTETVSCYYAYQYYVGTTKKSGNGNVYYYITCKPVNISLDGHSSNFDLSLSPNQTHSLSVTYSPSNAPAPSITWDSSNPTVATVENGIISTIKEGTTVIKAKNNSGPNVSCNVTVKRTEPTSVKLPANETVEAKKSITLSPKLEPNDAQTEYKWESSDKTVATVTDGIVTGVKSGKATIKVTTHNNLSATCEVEVLPEKITLTSNVESGLIAIGTIVSLSASVPTAKIYYTLNGTIPTQESLLYTEPIKIVQSLTLKAKAFLNGYGESEILTREFIVTSLPAKTIFPEQGTQMGSGHVIPSISFYERVVEGNCFENICLMRDNILVEGTSIIQDSTFFFVPNNALEDNNYQLLVPSNAIRASVSEKSYNGPIHINFSVGKTISGDLTPVISAKDHSLVVKTDGSLWAWGKNDDGELGDGTTTNRYSPIKVHDNVVYATTGHYHSMAISTDGSLWTWGRNGHGELGDGTTTERLLPVKVLDNVVAIAAGQCYSMAIKKDGSLWAWGYNEYGQIGDGTNTDRAYPVKVLEGVSSIATNRFQSMALKEDGSLWTWGYNQFGTLGDGTTTDRSLPQKVLDNVVAISAGYSFCMAIKKDGSLWTWGYNFAGQVGDGTTTNRSTPVNVLTNVKSISAGLMHCMAVKNDGSLWTWGYNGSGEIGDGTKTERHSPKKVMNNVCSIAAGNERSMAIKEDGSLWEWGVIKYQNQKEIIQGHLVYLSEKSKTPIKLFESMDNVIELPVLTHMSISEQIHIIEGKKSLIIPYFEPIDADYKTMEWNSNNESIVTVSPRGIVNGLTPGEATITVKIKSNDGTEHLASCKVTVVGNTPKGDIDGDGEVDGFDIVVLVNKIMGRIYDSAADIDGDGEVDGFDIVALVNIIMKKEYNARELMAARSEDNTSGKSISGVTIGAEPLSTDNDGSCELTITLTNPKMDVTMVQMDVTLPEGVSLDDDGALMGGRTTQRSHSLYTSDLDEHTVRILLVSGNNALVEGAEGSIIRLPLTIGEGFLGGDIVLDNILCASPDLSKARPQALTLHLQESGVMAISTTGTVDEGITTVHNLTGQRLTAPQKGVNIVNGKKVIMK